MNNERLHMDNEQTLEEEETLTDDIKKIIGGVATIVLLVVPIVLVRKLIRTIEEGSAYKTIERTLS